MEQVKPRLDVRLTSAILLLLAASGASAITVKYPPLSDGPGQSIAANAPESGNVWTGVAQSFTAQDTRINFGFYIQTFASDDSYIRFQYSLYAGDGDFSKTPLAVRHAIVRPTAFSEPGLVEAEFSDVELSLGKKYTMEVSQLDYALPLVGEYSSLNIRYAGVAGNEPDPYYGGTFYYAGSSYLPSLFSDRDIAFEMTAALAPAAAVPEPGTYAFMMFGVAAIAAYRRTAGRASA